MKEKIKENKGFIQIPILIVIIVGVLAITGGGYLGFRQYQNYQKEKVNQEKITQDKEKQAQEKEKQAQALAETQQKALEDAQREIKKLKQGINEQKTDNSLSAIIDQWRSSVAYVECESHYSDGELYYTASGSGILHDLVRINDDNTEDLLYTIYSNKHILADPKGYSSQNCRFAFPGYKKIFTVFGPENILISKKFDFAYIIINEPDDYIKKHIPTRFCEKASIGDEVVIIGYPAIGSPTDITATEGIISGLDGNYYITSAKIDSGNSGGAAILVKGNCYLGIPTFAIIGQVESLGRILNYRSVR